MLELTLLGTPQILLDGQPLVLRPRNSARAKAILYYLAAEGRPVGRERLAGLLWSDWPEKKAREYLRGELFLLSPLRASALQENDGRLSLDPASCNSDLARFRGLSEGAGADVEALDAALRLWTGSFLQDFESAIEAGAALYLEWLQEQRSAWAVALRTVRYRLAERAAQTQNHLREGVLACAHLLAEEPEREEVHRLKMRLLALDGQRVAALKQYDECTTALLDELGVPPSAETNALYDQIVAGEIGPQAAAAAPVMRAAPFQAPARAGHFVGREGERSRLMAWLDGPQRSAIAAVVGMGGAGKTALAAEVAHALRDRFPDGVLWARVSENDPLDILQSWALAYDKDLSQISSAEARAAAMRNLLAAKRALVVLDDVVAGSALHLLLPGAACHVLITTRDWTEVAAHTTQIVELAELTPAEGLALLGSYLSEASVQAEEEAAIQLCATLGGLPLAVEIAAQRVFASPRRSLARMARSLQDAGDRLAHGISNRSVRTSFNVSWEAIPAPLQRLFALTGIFAGRSFTAATLAAVAGAEEADDVADELDQLATLSMLKVHTQERYVHHRLLADFAGEKLAEQPDADAARLRLAEACRTLVQRAAGAYDLLEPEWDNLLAGILAAHEQGAWALVAASVDGLTAPWFARARFTQAQQGFRWAMDAAAALGDDSRYAAYAYYLAKIHVRQDNYTTARQLIDGAIRVFQTNANQPRLADAYVDLADVAFEQGEHDEALASLEAAELLYQQLQQPVGLASVKSRQALIAYTEDRDDDARRLCEAGLSCLPAGDGSIVRSRTLRLLTDLALRAKQLDDATEFCYQAQVANQVVNDPTETAAILYAQAKLDHFMGDHAAALANAVRSAELYIGMGDRKAQAIINHFAVRLHLALNETAAAHAAAEYGLELAVALDDSELIDLYNRQLSDILKAAAT